MWTRAKNRVVTCMMILFFLTMSLCTWIKRPDAFSGSERRALAQFPKLSVEMIASGKFMEEFESYSLDQFPMRDAFRSLKAFFTFYVFRQRDNEGIYLAEDYACKLEYPLQEASLDRAAERFSYVYEKYLEDTDSKVYFSIIPDKNLFLAERNGYPAID